jgi:hypothetical protein
MLPHQKNTQSPGKSHHCQFFAAFLHFFMLHNCRIWGSQPPQEIIEHQRDMPKVNVWSGMMKDRIIGPFFFQERTVTSHLYLDMLEHYAVPQLPCDAWFQWDGASPHFGNTVRQFLNERFPNKWIGRGSFLAWPPRSPDLTPLD